MVNLQNNNLQNGFNKFVKLISAEVEETAELRIRKKTFCFERAILRIDYLVLLLGSVFILFS